MNRTNYKVLTYTTKTPERSTEYMCNFHEFPLARVYSVNIQSLTNKLPNVEVLLNSENPALFLLTQHWMCSEQAQVIAKEGYKLEVCYCRSSAAHGKEAIFSKQVLQCKVIFRLDRYAIESVCAGVSVEVNGNEIAILVLHGPPRASLIQFLKKLHSILSFV